MSRQMPTGAFAGASVSAKRVKRARGGWAARTPQQSRGGKKELLFSVMQVTEPITPAGGPATERPSVYGSPMELYVGSLKSDSREYRRRSTGRCDVSLDMTTRCGAAEGPSGLRLVLHRGDLRDQRTRSARPKRLTTKLLDL